jgi:ankyrin repeat protein
VMMMTRQVVKLLVEKGADISVTDNEGLTALINAAEVGPVAGRIQGCCMRQASYDKL